MHKRLSLSILTLVVAAGSIAAEPSAFRSLKEQAGVQDLALSDFREHGRRGDPDHRPRHPQPAPVRRDDRGREAAMQSCMKASWDRDKEACVKAANAAQYLDPSAASACGSMSWGNKIADCINAIAEKTYTPSEVQLCVNNSWDDGKVNCFKAGGRPVSVRHERPRYERRPDLDSYILHRLRQIRSDMESGRIPTALAGIIDLLSFVEDGMNGR